MGTLRKQHQCHPRLAGQAASKRREALIYNSYNDEDVLSVQQEKQYCLSQLRKVIVSSSKVNLDINTIMTTGG